MRRNKVLLGHETQAVFLRIKREQLQLISHAHVLSCAVAQGASERQASHVPGRKHLQNFASICGGVRASCRIPAAMPHCCLLPKGCTHVLMISAVLTPVPETPVCVGGDIQIPLTVVATSCSTFEQKDVNERATSTAGNLGHSPREINFLAHFHVPIRCIMKGTLSSDHACMLTCWCRFLRLRGHLKR